MRASYSVRTMQHNQLYFDWLHMLPYFRSHITKLATLSEFISLNKGTSS